MSMEANAKIIWNFLKAKGCSDAAAAGILGNLQRESGTLSPTTVQKGGGPGRGIAQWSYSERWQNLIKYARSINKSEWDLNVQLEYLWKELKSYENYFEKQGTTFKKFLASTDASSAAITFEKVFERAGKPAMSERVSNAQDWYKKYKGTGGNKTTVSSGSDSNSGKTNTEDGFNDERFYKYFKGKYLDIPDEVSVAMMDSLVKADTLRRIEPLDREDYIAYGHRYYSNIYNLTIGDCSFVIPPEFINITSTSHSQSIVTLRQENTQKIKNGYSKRTIVMDLVFHGVNQINGYKVEGPGGWYHVDGLRQLLAQFKCTPFLPVENFTINYTYNIHTVALQSIVCSTVEGFPDMITANIVLQEVDLYPYIEAHSMFFSNFIDWDLFRFYYQRQLTETHEYGKLQSIPENKELNNFRMSILDESVFNNSKEDYDTSYSFYDVIFDREIIRTVSDDNGKEIKADSNWVTYLDSSSSSVHIGTFQCGYSNILTNIQMAENSHPTIQYMGGMDTNFNIVFETTDENVVTALEQCNIRNDSIIRNHREVNGIGFVKLESELVELCGTKYVVIDNVMTSTVPGLPGLYNVQVSCVSFDVYQKQHEGINGMNPFEDRDGEMKDAIEQSFDGLENKINQDLCAETKIRTNTELYPDLKLPTYHEVDNAIHDIIKFRDTHTNIAGQPLSPYPLTNDMYPRTPQHMLHGITEVSNLNVNEYGIVTNVPDLINEGSNYEGYVDPDFYVFYPDTYKKMLDDTKEERDELGINYSNADHKASARDININYSNFGSDVSTHSDISNFDYELDAAGATELQNKFIALARKKKGATYSNARRLGPNSYDCSGLISKCLMEMGIISNSFTTAGVENLIKSGVLREKYKVSSPSKYKELIAHATPGDMFHLYGRERGTSMGHIAIYAGNNKIVHASSSKNKVCEVPFNSASFGFLRVLEVTKLVKGAKSSVASQKVTVKTKTNVNFNLKNGDSGTKVEELQKLLNRIDNAGLEPDGDYGTLTEEAVKAFQKKNGITVTGKVDAKTCTMLNKVANKDIKESSANTTITSGKDAKYITELELERIAKTIAKLQFGKPYSSQVALAQLIYDKLMNSNNGNLNHILDDKIFKGEYSKSIKLSTAYKAAQNVFCNAERAYPYVMKNFLGLNSGNSDYLTMDNKYDRLGTAGEFTFWGDKKKKSKEKKFTLIPDSEASDKKTVSSPTVDNNINKKVGADEVEASFARFFGKPIVMKSEDIRKDSGFWKNGFLHHNWRTREQTYQKEYNTPEQILMSSFVNQCEFSGKGRLVKAFPTYLFCIVDDDGNWLDGKKLWSNYYMLRSLVEINVASYNDSPINTATISVTNSYGNLDTLSPDAFYYSPKNDEDFNIIQRTLYKYFGLLPGFGPKLTDDLITRKNIIYKSMVIRAGCRMHLRMGYGSDPLSLPVIMNGYISDLSVGDITTFVCISDGVELTNAIISDNPNNTNGIFENQEASNIFIDIMTKRQSWLNKVNSAWGEPSKYGIEHFGLYFSEHVNWFPGANWTIDLPATGDAETDKILGIAEKALNVASDAVELALNTGATAIENIGTMGKLIGDGIFKGVKTVEYDLIKNIYRTSYDGSLAMYTPFWGFFDGENNVCFNLYNKTPWDVMQVAVQNSPEYLGMPMYHQFDSRIFLGLPYFLAKYRYNKINGDIYEEAKSFSQVHFVDSLTDIIDNQMLTTSRGIFTNAIVMYTLGKTPTATPTLYSDKSIDFCKQSTKIFDTSVSQNFLGPDGFYQFMGADMGKEAACRIGISQLLYNWEKAYQGDLIMLGDGGINPCDYLYINDRFNQISGICTARTVIHTLSANTGFVTTITPGMIGFSTLQNSQSQVMLTNVVTVGSAFSYYMSIKKSIKETSEKMAEWYNWSKVLAKMQLIAQFGGGTILISGGIRSLIKRSADVKNIFTTIKDFKYVRILDEIKDFGKAIRGSVTTIRAASKAEKIGSLVKEGGIIVKAGKLVLNGGFKALGSEVGTAASPIIGTAIGLLVGTVLDILTTAIIDYFRWNNCIVLLPLMHKNSPYAPITSGDKLLIGGKGSEEDGEEEE